MFTSFLERVKGWKTIIFARALVLLGVLLTVLSALTGDEIGAMLPDKYRPFAPLVLALVGVVTEGLRRVTDGPVGAKGDEVPK
jgi:drug/metabolite transporter (DMT)-like permease